MARFIPVENFDIVIFGGTGDLSKRKLLPALFHRFLDGQIKPGCRIIGSARSKLTEEEFRNFAKTACHEATGDSWSDDKWAKFAKHLDYVRIDASSASTDWIELGRKLSQDDRPRVFYLSTSPSLYVNICNGLGANGLVNTNARVVLEKPIGHNLETTKAINDGVGKVFAEDSVFRIDHYLGKETVQNLLVLRFANTLFEPLWSRNAIDHIQITVAESLGLEGRGGYYDGSGALRDMVQNHLLQLLCLTSMEPPNSLEADDVRAEKIKVLRALKPIDATNIRECTVRAQYGPGLIDNKPVPGYLEELGEGSRSDTETFVAIQAEIENWRWAGVPFYLRTGKRMTTRRSEIIIQFKPTPHPLFGEFQTTSNRLAIRLQPDEGVRLFLQIKEPGPGGLRISSLPLNLSYADNFTIRYPDAYERLLMDVVRGNLSLFMRRDEVETAWKWVDTLLNSWSEANTSVESYPAGTDGPYAAAIMMDRNNRDWSEAGE